MFIDENTPTYILKMIFVLLEKIDIWIELNSCIFAMKIFFLNQLKMRNKTEFSLVYFFL